MLFTFYYKILQVQHVQFLRKFMINQQTILSTQSILLQSKYDDNKFNKQNFSNITNNSIHNISSQPIRNIKQKYILFKYFFVLFLLFINSQCTQIQIIANPNQQQLKAINLIKSLRRYRKRIINLNNDIYVCVTAVKQKPNDQSADGTDRAKLTAQYANGNLPATMKVDPAIYQTSLDLLDDNIGVRHHTKQFIYGYKHKKIVSQYDDETTKIINQKKELQNFTLGLFSLEYGQNTQTTSKVELLYLTYQNSHIYTATPQQNFFSQSDVPLKYRQSQYAHSHVHIDHQNSLLTLSNPLAIIKHTRSRTYNVTFLCYLAAEQGIKQQNYTRTMIGLSLTNYQLLLIHQIPQQCFSVTEIIKSQNWILSINPQINIFDNKLTGDLDKFCEIGYDNGLNVGDYILLQTERIVGTKKDINTNPNKNNKPSQKVQISIKENPISGQQSVEVQHISGKYVSVQQTVTDYFVLRIDQIIGQNLYLISKKLPWLLKPVKCKKIQKLPYKILDYSGHIDVKQVQMEDNQKIINFQSYKIIQFDYKGSNLIKIDKNHQRNHHRLKTGLQLFCLTKIAFQIAPQHPIFYNFGLTIGLKFSNDYYEVHPWIRYNLIQKFNEIGQFKGKTSCIPYKNGKESSQIVKTLNNSLSKTLKMSKNVNNRIKVDQNDDSIFSFTLTKDAVIEITTTINEEIPQKDNKNIQNNKKIIKQKGTNKYFIFSHKLYKFETVYKNGTKIRVERVQNEFYENNTNQNMVIVYQGIWRAGDFLKFPRFLFHSYEKITSIIVKHGTVFVRIVNLNTQNKQIYAVSSSSLTDKNNGFGPKVRPQKSLATQFKFSWGTFCGGVINKNRQTVIKIKCGYSWLKINSVLEVSPCAYEINAVSQFLCDQNVVFPALKQGFNVFNGSLCIPGEFYKSM